MRDCKIVFTGTPGAGKTTAIAAISDTPPVVTDVPNRDPSLAKARTTVGMDYGEVVIADLVRVRSAWHAGPDLVRLSLAHPGPQGDGADHPGRQLAARSAGRSAHLSRCLCRAARAPPASSALAGPRRTRAWPGPSATSWARPGVPVLPVDARARWRADAARLHPGPARGPQPRRPRSGPDAACRSAAAMSVCDSTPLCSLSVSVPISRFSH